MVEWKLKIMRILIEVTFPELFHFFFNYLKRSEWFVRCEDYYDHIIKDFREEYR